MYRTAVIRMYDVLDQVHVNAVVTEYSECPGTAQPDELVLATTIPSTVSTLRNLFDRMELIARPTVSVGKMDGTRISSLLKPQ